MCDDAGTRLHHMPWWRPCAGNGGGAPAQHQVVQLSLHDSRRRFALCGVASNTQPLQLMQLPSSSIDGSSSSHRTDRGHSGSGLAGSSHALASTSGPAVNAQSDDAACLLQPAPAHGQVGMSAAVRLGESAVVSAWTLVSERHGGRSSGGAVTRLPDTHNGGVVLSAALHVEQGAGWVRYRPNPACMLQNMHA